MTPTFKQQANEILNFFKGAHTMVFKVLFQTAVEATPKRETTESIYLEVPTKEDAIQLVETHTDYHIEFVEPLEGKSLEYEQQNPDYKLTTF